ncbi:MAG: LEA type 2 family protein [Bacteroidota bacterium]
MENESPQKQKRYWIPLLILLVLGAIAFGAWYYFARSPKKDEHIEKLIPHISMTHIHITDIDGERIKFTTNMVLLNSFPVNLSTSRIQYRIYIDTAMVIESSYDEKLNVASSDSITLDIPMEASMKRIVGILKEFKRQHIDSTDYRVEAEVYLDLPVAGERRFDFKVVKRMPTVIIPELKLADTDIKKLGFKESGVDMAFTVFNPNNYEIKLKDGHFDVKLDENLEMEGVMEDIKLPAKGKQTISIHFDIRSNKLGKAVWKMIFNKKGTHFNFVFKGIADANNDILNNTNLVITADGTLDEALEAAKEVKNK